MNQALVKVVGLIAGLTTSYFVHEAYGGRYYTMTARYTVDGMTGDLYRSSDRVQLIASFDGLPRAPAPKPTKAQTEASLVKLEAELAAERVKVEAEVRAAEAEALPQKTGAKPEERFLGVIPKPEVATTTPSISPAELAQQVAASGARARARYPSITSDQETSKALKAYIETIRADQTERTVLERGDWPEVIADRFFYDLLVNASYDRAYARYPQIADGGANHLAFQRYVEKNAQATFGVFAHTQFPEKMAEAYVKLIGANFDQAVSDSRDRAYRRWPQLNREPHQSKLIEWVTSIQNQPSYAATFSRTDYPEIIADQYAKSAGLKPSE